jgi:hypothetical protein
MPLIPRLALLGSVFFVGAAGACGQVQRETSPPDDGGAVEGSGPASEDARVVDAEPPPPCPPCGLPAIDASGPESSDGGDAGVIALHDAGEGGPSDGGAHDGGPNDSSIDQFSPVPYDAAGAVAFGGGCASAACGGKGAPLDLSFAMDSGLAPLWGSVAVTLPGYSDPACQLSRVLVIQISPGVFAAFAGSDTRTCCPLTVKGDRILDPCHASEYDFCGAPARSPASTSLQQLPACASADGVEVWAP